MFLGFLDPLPLSPCVNLHLDSRCKLSTEFALQTLAKLLLFLLSHLTLSSCTSRPAGTEVLFSKTSMSGFVTL